MLIILMLGWVRTFGVMPPSIQHSATETDEPHATTDIDAHHEFVVGRPGTARAVVMGGR